MFLFSFCPSHNAQTVPANTYYNRLFYTAKVWGYIKYFHSNVAKGNLNWDEELISTIKKVKIDNSETEFNKTLLNLLKRAGHLSYPNTTLPNVPDSLKFNLDLNWLQNPIFSDSVSTELDSIRIKYRPQNNHYVGKVSGAGNPTFDTDNQFYQRGINQYPDEEHRLLALFRHWNIINYFSPYKNIIDQNWDSTLVEFIPKIINTSNQKSFHLVFLELATRLNDSHAYTFSDEVNKNIFGKHFLPFVLKYVENKTVITSVLDNNYEIKIGDVIKSINGTDITIFRDSLRKYTHGSNISRINFNINNRIIRGNYDYVDLIIENSEGQKDITISRNISYEDYYKLIVKTNEIWEIIKSDTNNFGYVDMGRLEKTDISNMFSDLWYTDAIIFDIRNYPKGTMWDMVKYFFDTPINVANFTVPDIRHPGTLFWVNAYVGQNNSTSNYGKPIFILFDESTQSQAEYTIMAFEQHPKAVKIGSQTSGADGNVSKIYLPGGIITYFTGLGTFYSDYSQTQRIGIVPDVEILPTIVGIREGRDELLEAALNHYITSIDEKESSEIPKEFTLHQNYPNPFNPSTTIKYTIPSVVNSKFTSTKNVVLRVFDLLGREIITLVNKKQNPGYYEIIWDAKNNPSGVYFYQLTAGNFVETRKMILLR